MGPMRERRAWWIGGTLTALVGVGLARLLAPELSGFGFWAAIAFGYALVAAGIGILAFATRRKPSEAYITVPRKDRGRAWL